MAATFELSIATPEKQFYEGEAECVILKTTSGEIGVLAGHVPSLVALAAAPLRVKKGDQWLEAALSGGFAEITTDSVSILVDTAEWPEEIEVSRALEAKRRAEERMLVRQSEVEYIRSLVALQRALTRITVAKGSGYKKT